MTRTDEKEKMVDLQCDNKETEIWLIVMTSPDILEVNDSYSSKNTSIF